MKKMIILALLGLSCAFYLYSFKFGPADDDTDSASANRSASLYRLFGSLYLMLASLITLGGFPL